MSNCSGKVFKLMEKVFKIKEKIRAKFIPGGFEESSSSSLS
jgi:hypothetical protein